MAFNSNIFIFLFLPLCLLIYYLSHDKIKNYVLLFASIIFYAWGSPNTLIVLLASIAINYILISIMEISKGKSRKLFLVLSLVFNIGILAGYKYIDFFLSGINVFTYLAGFAPLTWRKLSVPIGLSYITFQQISYIVDIYKDKDKSYVNPLDYVLYILIFPRLIAGPIMLYHETSIQFKERTHSFDKFSYGIWRFSIGMFKKVAIANSLGLVADNIFSTDPSLLGIKYAWFGMVLYTFQLFFDFSGYSDMAVGIGKMFGFDFPENFNRPYISKSITEFWKRWHMSLSRFLKEYIYIPLGGNRVSTKRTYINLWIVFLISGLWHGAAMTFVIWGIYHGTLLILERVYLLKVYKKLPAIISNGISFILVGIGWVFFRSESLSYALRYLKAMFTLSFAEGINFYNMDISLKTFVALLLAVLISFIRYERFQDVFDRLKSKDIIKYVFSLIILIYSLAALSSGTYSPFIYFKF